MMAYIVEGHLGTWYLSNENIRDIERVCEQCGDWDTVVGQVNLHEPNAAEILLDAYASYQILPEEEDLTYYTYSNQELQDMWEKVEDAFSKERVVAFGEMLQRASCGMELSDEIIDDMVSKSDEYIKKYRFLLDAI